MSSSSLLEIESSSPAPRETTWLPVLLLSSVAGLLLAGGIHNAQSLWIVAQDRGVAMIVVGLFAFGCVVGYANQRYIWKKALVLPPFAVFVVLTLAPREPFVYWSAVALTLGACGFSLQLLDLGGTLRLLLLFLLFPLCIWGLFILSLFGLEVFLRLLAVALGLIYGGALAGVGAGFCLRWIVAGKWKPLKSPSLDRLFAPRFSLISLFALTTLAALTAFALRSESLRLPPYWMVLYGAAILAGELLALVIASTYSSPANAREPTLDDLRQLRDLPRPWVRCERCGQVGRRTRTACSCCNTPYPQGE